MVKEVKEYFNIEDDFTAKEKEKIMAEDNWAFECKEVPLTSFYERNRDLN